MDFRFANGINSWDLRLGLDNYCNPLRYFKRKKQ